MIMGMALDFINGYAGMYVVQCLAHSLIAAIVADSCIVAWDVKTPWRKQLVRMNVLVLPLLMYPAFEFINPGRSSFFSRPWSLLDANRWLQMDLWEKLPVIIPVAIVLGLTSIVFLLQEFLPVLRHTVESISAGHEGAGGSRSGEQEQDDPTEEPDKYDIALETALDGISGPRPESYIIEDDDLVIFSSTGRKPAIYVSTGFIDAFDADELRAALAHEAGHIRRSRHPVLIALFVLRVVMFFNPVALLEFRKIVQEEERICDEIAVELTGGDTRPLASALARLMVHHSDDADQDGAGIGNALESIENYSHDMQMRNRIKRLLERRAGPDSAGWLHYAAAVVTTVAICYFVV